MGERVKVELTGLAHGGEALGRHAGRVLFVPYGAPGELVLVEIVEESRNWARARLVEVLKPSPQRIAPPCPHFGHCAGCQLQHLSYAAQLNAKREVVRDQLARLGRLPDLLVHPVVGMADPWHYRNQAQLFPTAEGALGIKAGPQAQPIAVDVCPLFHPLLEDLFEALDLEIEGLERVGLRAGACTGDALMILETAGDEAPDLEVDVPLSIVLAQHDGDVRVLIGDEWIHEVIAGRRLRISAPSPFPANTEMAERMVQLTGDLLRATSEDVLLDIGSGVGLFGLTLAGAAGGLLAVESNAWASGDLLANAGDAPAVGVIEGPVAESLADIEAGDLAIVQAPRTGIGPEVTAQLGRLAPRRLVYVAEDPATLARDVAGLGEAGFRLAEVQPVDLLPQTYHIHVLGLWER